MSIYINGILKASSTTSTTNNYVCSNPTAGNERIENLYFDTSLGEINCNTVTYTGIPIIIPSIITTLTHLKITNIYWKLDTAEPVITTSDESGSVFISSTPPSGSNYKKILNIYWKLPGALEYEIET